MTETNLDKLFSLEDCNFQHIEHQANGIMLQLESEWQDMGYIKEKINNMRRFFNEVVDNFELRVNNPKIREEFKKRLKGWEEMNADFEVETLIAKSEM